MNSLSIPFSSKINLSVPSKTFLVGEYAVLKGAPALVLGHQPRFELKVHSRGQGNAMGFHPESPAGKWLRRNSSVLQNLDFEFKDPHQGLGGFGASSAQFALIDVMLKMQGAHWSQVVATTPEQIWLDFQSLFEGQHHPPSGADVVAQVQGGVTRFQRDPMNSIGVDWPFPELGFLIAPTGVKIATHDHLTQEIPTSPELIAAAEASSRAFAGKQQNQFLKDISVFAEELERLGLVADHTRGLIAQLSSNQQILFSKGCGALGADVVLVMAKTADLKDVADFMRKMDLAPIASHLDLSPGLKVEIELEPFEHQRGTMWV